MMGKPRLRGSSNLRSMSRAVFYNTISSEASSNLNSLGYPHAIAGKRCDSEGQSLKPIFHTLLHPCPERVYRRRLKTPTPMSLIGLAPSLLVLNHGICAMTHSTNPW